MAIPSTAVVLAESMDPSDVLDFAINCSPILDSGDSITSYTIVAAAEAALLGLQVNSSLIADAVVYFWLSISPGKSMDAAFTLGASLPLELTLTTQGGRKLQRTVVVKVIQR